MLLDYKVEVAKQTSEGMFYRLNIDNKAKVWFLDDKPSNSKPRIFVIYASVASPELKDFDVFVETEDTNFYYSSVHMAVRSMPITSAQKFVENVNTVSDICDTIDNFFKNDFLNIRKGEPNKWVE